MQLQPSVLLVFGVFTKIPNSNLFGPPAVQLAFAVICVAAIALALIGDQRHKRKPTKRKSEDAKL